MNSYIINSSTLAEIGDTIRDKSGISESIPVPEIPKHIENVYKAGKKAEYDEFWDTFQSNGKLTSYNYAFAFGRWNDDTFRPKHNIVPTNADFMFAYNYLGGTITNSQSCITNLVKCLENAGVTLDTSHSTSMAHIFYYAKELTSIPPISFENCTELNAAFFGCANLQRIEKLILKADGTNTMAQQSWSAPFLGCTSLKNILIEGVIGDSVNFSDSPLTAESLVSIVEHLSDTATGKTAYFREKAISSANWTTTSYTSWDELVNAKPNWSILLA